MPANLFLVPAQHSRVVAPQTGQAIYRKCEVMAGPTTLWEMAADWLATKESPQQEAFLTSNGLYRAQAVQGDGVAIVRLHKDRQACLCTRIQAFKARVAVDMQYSSNARQLHR